LELIACLTGWAGASVSLRDTLAGVRAIRDGSADDLPVVAFAYRGNLDDVRAHVAAPRRYGRGA
jgi:F0F1-type ATP synthase beta subunit